METFSPKVARRTLRNSQFLSSLDLQMVISKMEEGGTLEVDASDSSSDSPLTIR